jgi:hypothetical protein
VGSTVQPIRVPPAATLAIRPTPELHPALPTELVRRFTPRMSSSPGAFVVPYEAAISNDLPRAKHTRSLNPLEAAPQSVQ